MAARIDNAKSTTTKRQTKQNKERRRKRWGGGEEKKKRKKRPKVRWPFICVDLCGGLDIISLWRLLQLNLSTAGLLIEFILGSRAVGRFIGMLSPWKSGRIARQDRMNGAALAWNGGGGRHRNRSDILQSPVKCHMQLSKCEHVVTTPMSTNEEQAHYQQVKRAINSKGYPSIKAASDINHFKDRLITHL